VKNTIRNTIKIVLQTEFDLMIAQLKSKIGMIADSKRRYYHASTRMKVDIPLRRNKVG
jgi:hypothetical protein